MAVDLIKWLAIGSSIVLGLGLILEPMLIRSLPTFIHYLLGGSLLAGGAWGLYKAVK